MGFLTIYWHFTLFQQQAALMAAATAQGTYINPMAALATQIPHATLNGMANSVVPPTSGDNIFLFRTLHNRKVRSSDVHFFIGVDRCGHGATCQRGHT